MNKFILFLHKDCFGDVFSEVVNTIGKEMTGCSAYKALRKASNQSKQNFAINASGTLPDLAELLTYQPQSVFSNCDRLVIITL